MDTDGILAICVTVMIVVAAGCFTAYKLCNPTDPVKERIGAIHGATIGAPDLRARLLTQLLSGATNKPADRVEK